MWDCRHCVQPVQTLGKAAEQSEPELCLHQLMAFLSWPPVLFQWLCLGGVLGLLLPTGWWAPHWPLPDRSHFATWEGAVLLGKQLNKTELSPVLSEELLLHCLWQINQPVWHSKKSSLNPLKGRAHLRAAVHPELPGPGFVPHPWWRAQAGEAQPDTGTGGDHICMCTSPGWGCLRTWRKDCSGLGAHYGASSCREEHRVENWGLLSQGWSDRGIESWGDRSSSVAWGGIGWQAAGWPALTSTRWDSLPLLSEGVEAKGHSQCSGGFTGVYNVCGWHGNTWDPRVLLEEGEEDEVEGHSSPLPYCSEGWPSNRGLQWVTAPLYLQQLLWRLWGGTTRRDC